MKLSLATLTLKAKIIIAAVSITVITAAAVTAGVLLTREDAYRVLKVFELTGSATVSRESAGELEAYVGMNLESGDTVSVGEESTMRLSLDSDKYILLDSGTVLELIATGTEKDSRTTINLKEGTILNEITNALSENSFYEVNTPKATMAVRGTSFSVSVIRDGDNFVTEVNTYHGKVAVQLLDEEGNPKGEEVLIEEGYGTTIVTEPNESSGRDPAIDGNSYFAQRSGEADVGYQIIANGASPVHLSDYSYVSNTVLERVVGSDSDGTLSIADEIIERILGGDIDVSELEEETETEAVESDTVTTAYAENLQTTSPTVGSEDSAPVTDSVVSEANYNEPMSDEPDEIAANSLDLDEGEEDNAETEAPSLEERYEEEPTVTTVPISEEEEESVTERTYEETTVTSLEEEQPLTTTVTTTESEDTESTTTSIYRPSYYTGTTTAYYTDTTPNYGTSVSETTAVQTETYKIVFGAQTPDGTGYAYDYIVNIGETLGFVPEIPECGGYTGKWIIDGTDTEFTADTVITADITVTAVYTVSADAVELVVYDNVNNRLVDSGVYSLTGTYTMPSDLSDYTDADGTRYVFSGWGYYLSGNVSNAVGTVLDGSIETAADTAFEYSSVDSYSVFQAGTAYNVSEFNSMFSAAGITHKGLVALGPIYDRYYAVTFVDEYGAAVATVYCKEYTTLTETEIPKVPTKDGYTGKWIIDGTDTEFTAATEIYYSVTVKAEYTLDLSNLVEVVVYDNNTNTLVASDVYSYTNETTYIMPDARPMYIDENGARHRFKGWGACESGGGEGILGTVLDGSIGTLNEEAFDFYITSYPFFEAGYGCNITNFKSIISTEGITHKGLIAFGAVYEECFEVKFVDETGATLETAYCTYEGTIASIPDIPSKDGYTGKWIIEGTDTEFTTSTKVTEDITVELQYELVTAP